MFKCLCETKIWKNKFNAKIMEFFDQFNPLFNLAY